MSKKHKLTLSVDEEVAEKAKEIGINISELTENVLKSFTFEPSEADDPQIRERYGELFDTMTPLLQRFEIPSVEIGRGVETGGEHGPTPYHLYLWTDGSLHFEDLEKEISIDDIPVSEFLWPREILEKFIDEIAEGAKRRKRRLKETKAVKRIVDAISDLMVGR